MTCKKDAYYKFNWECSLNNSYNVVDLKPSNFVFKYLEMWMFFFLLFTIFEYIFNLRNVQFTLVYEVFNHWLTYVVKFGGNILKVWI